MQGDICEGFGDEIMTPEQSAAYINSQVCMALIEMNGMVAENAARKAQGQSPAYWEDSFARLPTKYQIGHNDVMKIINDSNQ